MLTNSDVADRLRDLRAKTKKNQEQVAEACGISKVALARYETGTRRPKLDIAAKLAEYYGVSLDYIQGGKEPLETTEMPIDPHTYYAEQFGPETQAIIDELLAKLQAMPEDKREDAAKGALTFVRGLENERKNGK